jgi:serine/threonine-protein kinase
MRECTRWFHRIAQVAASLDHPGIVPCHEVGEGNGQPYLALALVRGSDLMRRIGAPEPRLAEEAVHIVCDVAAALHYAHSRDVIHGHLHPKHILVDEAGCARLIGFGECPLPEGAVFGNAIHLAPEQLTSLGTLTPQTDVYGLAETAYWLLTGSHPYGADSVGVMLGMKSSGSAIRLRTIWPDLSAAVTDVLQRAMATKPEDRFSSAAEFGDALTKATARGRRGKRWWELWK